MNLVVRLLASVVICCIAVAARADISYPNFSSTAGLNLQSAAVKLGNALRLTATSGTNVGSAWFATQQPVANGFSTTFQFQITQPGGITDGEGNPGGDGLAFVIQNSSGTAIGSTAAGIGYSGIANSVAIEFDTYQNTVIGDPNGNHISVQTGGTAANSEWADHSLGFATNLPNFSDGNVHTAGILYQPGTLTISFDGTNVLTTPLDLATKLNLNTGSAWVGFTASVFAASENHDLLNWSLTAVPEPSSLAIFGIGIVGLVVGECRRKRTT